MMELHKGMSLDTLNGIREDREELMKHKKNWLEDGKSEINATLFNDGGKGIERLKSARILADLLIVRCEDEITNLQIAFYLNEYPIIGYLNEFLDKVNKYIKDDVLEEEKVFEVAKDLAFNCSTLEEVKLGLTLLSLFNLENYVEELMTLGIYNEYSYYVSRLFVNIKESNKYLFKLCKECTGVAKINYLIRLEALDEEVVDWIISKGLEGDLYTKLIWDIVLMKIDLENISSKHTMNRERFISLTNIMLKIYLSYGFDDIQNFTNIIRNYLSYFNEYAENFEEFIALKLIYKDLIDRRDEGVSFSKNSLGKNSFGDLEELYIKAQRTYLKVDWEKELTKAIDSDDNNSTLIFQVAIEMEDDLTLEEIYKVLKKDPYETLWYNYIEALEDTEYSNLLVKFVEENINLDKILSGPKNLRTSQLSIDDREYDCLLSMLKCLTYDAVKENQDFIITILSASLIEARMKAIELLEMIKVDWEYWVEDAIKSAIDEEVNSLVQDREMALVYEKEKVKVDKILPTDMYLEPQEDDLFLMDTVISSKTIKNYENIDDIFQPGKLVCLELDDEDDSVLVVSNFGVILGEIHKNDRTIIKNLLKGRETLYGRIENASKDLDFVYLKVYIKKESLIVEISNALKDALL